MNTIVSKPATALAIAANCLHKLRDRFGLKSECCVVQKSRVKRTPPKRTSSQGTAANIALYYEFSIKQTLADLEENHTPNRRIAHPRDKAAIREPIWVVWVFTPTELEAIRRSLFLTC